MSFLLNVLVAMGPLTVSLVSNSATADQSSQPESVVEFHIAAGTGEGVWNTQDTMLMAKVGDTIRIINDDTIGHQLHTNGAPCGHGPFIPVGTSWDCKATRAYSSMQNGPLYDHQFGDEAEFWLEVAP